jgi:hypothetical protein
VTNGDTALQYIRRPHGAIANLQSTFIASFVMPPAPVKLTCRLVWSAGHPVVIQ